MGLRDDASKRNISGWSNRVPDLNALVTEHALEPEWLLHHTVAFGNNRHIFLGRILPKGDAIPHNGIL